MKLYHSPMSPYVRKVMVLLHETGQLDDVDIATITTTPQASDETLVTKNPLGKIPALERADGPTLYDSRVICAYLDARGGDKLYPTGGRRWDTLTLEATAEGILDTAVLMVYEGRAGLEGAKLDIWHDLQWEKISRACGALNARWMSHLSGPLDMGQIAVGCALGYLDLRHDARNWRKGHEALANWYAEFESRPAMQATRPG